MGEADEWKGDGFLCVAAQAIELEEDFNGYNAK